MSWIFGFYSKNSFDPKYISELHPQPIATVTSSKYYIAIGGNNHTLFYEKADPFINYFFCFNSCFYICTNVIIQTWIF